MIQAGIRKTCRTRPGEHGFRLEAEFVAAEGVTAVFGPAGAGKTILLEAIAGLVKPDEGRILVDGRLLFDGAAGVDLPPVSRPCGYLPRGSALFPHMTLRDNLLFAAGCRHLPRLEGHRRVNDLLERFGLAPVSRRHPREIATVDQQRSVIARALVGQPKLLLVDDLASELDAPLRSQWYDLLRLVRSEFDLSILVSTREVEDCFELGDEMLVLIGGKLAQAGTPRLVMDQPAGVEVARALGSYNLLPVEITALDPARKTSRLRLGEGELVGPYFPGRLRGDRVTLCVRPTELAALPAAGRPDLNQVAGRLLRVTEMPRSVRLQFEGEITVEITPAEYQQRKHHREWVIEFPPQCLRVL